VSGLEEGECDVGVEAEDRGLVKGTQNGSACPGFFPSGLQATLSDFRKKEIQMG
jgi:hypothetical protein